MLYTGTWKCPSDKLSNAELEALLDPASYVGEAQEISRRILAAYPDYAGTAQMGATRG
jgi:3-carboxy-cis,cis-muconate cycloisomerase